MASQSSAVAARKHRIVFLDRETLGAKLRRPSFSHEFIEYAATNSGEIVERLVGASICITNKVPISEETLAALPDLQMIAVAATGTDIIDKHATRSRGIVVSNIRDYAYNTVPEHVMALMFALRRNLISYVGDVAAGAWSRSRQFCFFPHPIRDIAGSTLGIVGIGALGKAVATRAEALGMKVLACGSGPAPGRVDLNTLLANSDVVSLHAPLTPETRHMIGRPQLELMRPDAILINTSRGGLLDEPALADALRRGVIGGAGLDVLSVEPPPPDHVLLDRTIPNLIVTPHIAWASGEAMHILADQLIDNIEAFVAGHPRNIV